MTRGTARGALAVLGLMLVLPAASAASGAVSLASPDPLALQGRLVADLPAALAFLESAPRTLDARFSGLDGEVRVYTWKESYSEVATVVQADPEVTESPVSGGTLDWTLRAEDASFRLTAPEGRVLVSGLVDDRGLPATFGRVAVREVEGPWPGPRRPPQFDVRWEPEWRAVGTFAPDHVPMEAFPRFQGATLDAQGGVSFIAWGGNATFVDAAGATRTVRLGAWDSPAPLYPATPAVRERTYVILRFDGTLAGASLPLSEGWGVAAPGMSLALDGTAAWTRATGDARVGGERTTFHDAAVTLDFAGTLVDAPPASAAAPGPLAYRAEGEVRALRVDGATVTAPPQVDPRIPAAVTGLALLALLATKAGQALLAAGAASLYTRLSAADILRHPKRRRLHELVTASPGIHQRELHRRVGGAWGPFAFHLRMLARSGHVHVVRQGAYTLLYPAGTVADGSLAIPHPVARAVYEAVPTDGSPIPLAQVVSAVGVSRELVNYHLRVLEQRGLVHRVHMEGTRRGVARLATSAEPPAA